MFEAQIYLDSARRILDGAEMIQVKLSMSTTFLCRQIQSNTSLVYYEYLKYYMSIYTILINRWFPESLTALTFLLRDPRHDKARCQRLGIGLDSWCSFASFDTGIVGWNMDQHYSSFMFFVEPWNLIHCHHLYSCHMNSYYICQFFLISAIHTTSRDVFISPCFFPTFFWCETSWTAWQSSSRVRFNEMLKAKVRQLP